MCELTNGMGTAWHVRINERHGRSMACVNQRKAWERHGMCELTKGMGAAWHVRINERHGRGMLCVNTPLGAHHILHVSGVRFNVNFNTPFKAILLCISW